MGFSRTAYCDWCETRVPLDDEDDLLESGWVLVKVGAGDEDLSRDFCSLGCLAKWAGSPSAVELVEKALRGEED